MLKRDAANRKLWRLSILRKVAMFVAVVAVGSVSAADQIFAQSDALGQIQSVLQGLGSGSGSGSNSGGSLGGGTANLPQNVTLQPATANSAPLLQSRLEQILSARAGIVLHQFGYDELGTGQPVTVPQAGALQDNYILGSGDEIVISLRGQDNSEYRTQVDRNGQVTMPKVSPILASGRTLGDFRQDLANAVRRAYIATQVFVSLGQLRQISVMVTGEVGVPGTRQVTGLSTPSDAILLSGGIKKTGSLRNVRLIRGGKQTVVDLYSILTQHGSAQQTLLTDGDRIVVPPLGPTVAVAGWLRRPGIYELPPGSGSISVRALISLAGGLEVRGRYRLAALRVAPNGSNRLEALKSELGILRDGELLFALPEADQIEQRATFAGGSTLAGQYAVGKATALSQLLKAPGALGDNPYMPFGLIVRHNPVTKVVSLIPFTPAAILDGREDITLGGNDVVRVFTKSEALLLSADIAQYQMASAQSEENLHSPLDASQAQLQNTLSQDVQSTGVVLSERQIVATLSAKTLDDGGVLSDHLPTNEYPPFGLTSDQTKFLENARPPVSPTVAGGASPSQLTPSGTAIPQLPLTATSSLAGVLASQGQLAGATSVPSANAQFPLAGLGAQNNLTINDVQPSAALPTPYQQSVASNFQEQQTSASEFPLNQKVETFGQLVRQLQMDPVVLMHFFNDQSMTISGSVFGPGIYLIGPHTTIHDLVAASGGTSDWTDQNHVELISSLISADQGRANTEHKIVALTDPTVDQYVLHPRDEIHFNKIDSKLQNATVTLQGQVRNSGSYNFERGERLSELLLRAGGLTDVAYPYGTVFLRKSAAAAERDGYRRAAGELQNIIVAGLSRVGTDKISPDAFTALNAFVTQLRNMQALGRIAVTADPVTLAANPDRDPLLEAGDVIYIPQRPSTVSVLGMVNQPGAFLFSPRATVEDYINRAGGYAPLSDKSLTFIVFPDGSARQADSSWLSFSSDSLPPGSAIVVQRDVAPIDARQLILDLSQVLQGLAVSAASLAVINSK